MRSLVLVGGGHAHLEVLRRFARRPLAADGLDDVAVTLLSPESRAAYTGRLPGVVAGLHPRASMEIDLGALAARAGARFCRDAATGLDLGARRIARAGGAPLAFDLLSLDVGAGPGTDPVAGAAEHAVPIKPVPAFLDAVDEWAERARDDPAFGRVVVVGAGAGGVEVVLALAHRLRGAARAGGRDPAELSFALVAAGATILPDFPPAMRRRLGDHLARRGVAVHLGAPVVRVDGCGSTRCVVTATGTLPADGVVVATGAAPPPWLAATGLALDARGFARVDACLRVIGHAAIFAAGDAAAFDPLALPKSGVQAVRQGPLLADNLRRAARGVPPRPFRARRSALYLITTGERHALGTRDGFVVEGDWVWRWKDWIDRRFVARYAP